jgi:hypothetical protein
MRRRLGAAPAPGGTLVSRRHPRATRNVFPADRVPAAVAGELAGAAAQFADDPAERRLDALEALAARAYTWRDRADNDIESAIAWAGVLDALDHLDAVFAEPAAAPAGDES